MSYCQDILPQPTKRRYDPSNKSALRQRNIGPVANDDVIQQPDVDQRQRLFDPLGDQFVRLAGLGDPGGVLGFISRCHHHLFDWGKAVHFRTLRVAPASVRGE
jgi:hypothetical protein